MSDDLQRSLFQAVRHKDIEEINRLVDQEGIDINTPDQIAGFTALMYAAEFDYPEICLALLHKGSNVDTQALDGTTALHLAAKNANLKIVEILIENNADPYLIDLRKLTALGHAQEKELRSRTSPLYIKKNKYSDIIQKLKKQMDLQLKRESIYISLAEKQHKGIFHTLSDEEKLIRGKEIFEEKIKLGQKIILDDFKKSSYLQNHSDLHTQAKLIQNKEKYLSSAEGQLSAYDKAKWRDSFVYKKIVNPIKSLFATKEKSEGNSSPLDTKSTTISELEKETDTTEKDNFSSLIKSNRKEDYDRSSSS